MMKLLTKKGTYECWGFDVRDDDGYVRHYREFRIDGCPLASKYWKAGRNGFEEKTGTEERQYQARCHFNWEWHH